jgi:putative mycofactocin binding protein MftB
MKTALHHREKGVRYTLAPGAQVREEDFGLLFYTMDGPRLYFLSCGDLLGSRFFKGKLTVAEWLTSFHGERAFLKARIPEIVKNLHHLKERGVLLEC